MKLKIFGTPRSVGSTSRQHTAAWISAGLTAWGIGFLFCWRFGVDTNDEAWFLQVVRRVAEGETLYRDVFFGAGPVSVLFSLPFMRWFGSEMLVLKALEGACFAASLLLACRIAAELHPSGKISPLVPAFLVAYFPPYPNSLYSPVAGIFSLAAFLFCLSWIRSHETASLHAARAGKRQLIAAGLCCGIAFAAKQNYGALTFAALTLTVLCSDAGYEVLRVRIRRMLPAAAGFAVAVTAVVAVPVLWGGGVDRFLDYAFFNKTTYVRYGHMPFLHEVRTYMGNVLAPSRAGLKVLVLHAGLVAPGIALPLAFGLWTAGHDRRRSAAVALFSAASVAGVYPRWDFTHVLFSVPCIVLALAYAWTALSSRFSKSLRSVISWIGIAWVLAGIGLAVRGVFPSKPSALSNLPHFRGACFNAEQYRILKESSARLRDACRGESVFLIGPDAGFFYLASGVRNPTPFDYPLITAFGRHGIRETEARFLRGDIRIVAIRVPQPTRMAPEALLRTVRENGTRIPGPNGFEMFTSG